MSQSRKKPGVFSYAAGMIAVLMWSCFLAVGLAYHALSRAGVLWLGLVLVYVIVSMSVVLQFVKRPGRRKVARLAATAILVFVILGPVVLMLPGGEGWERFTFEAEREAIEAERKIADADNAALRYASLFEGFADYPLHRDVVDHCDPSLLGGPWKSADDVRISSWLDGRGEMIAGLLDITKMDGCRFAIQEQIFDSRPYQHQLRFGARLLLIRANRDLGQGDGDGALDKYVAVMRLADHCQQQPGTLDFSTAQGIRSLALAAMQRFIVEDATEESQLEEIAETLHVEDYWDETWPRIVEGEKLQLKNAFGGFYEINAEGRIRFTHSISGAFGPDWESGTNRRLADAIGPAFLAAFAPWRPEGIAGVIDKMYAPLMSGDFDWREIGAFDSRKRLLAGRLPGIRIVFAFDTLSPSMLSKVRGKHLAHLALQRGTRLLAAIKLHELETGSYPETLGEVEAPAEARVDPTNGGGFIYKKTGEGFGLYSKGMNNIDQQGRYDPAIGADDIQIWPIAGI